MDAARMKEILKAEFGIETLEDLALEASNSRGVSLGIFTMPFKGGSANGECSEPGGVHLDTVCG
jgi:hypothetical protein